MFIVLAKIDGLLTVIGLNKKILITNAKKENDMIEGSCLCGKVRFVYNGDIKEIVMCHCSQCRKAQGGAFVTNSPIDAR